MEADDAREHLVAEQERLARLQAGIESDDEPTGELSHLDQHAADVASETFEREKDFSILEQVEAELVDVERALQRLDDGTYGTCEACGEVIADDRLAAHPAARFCVPHQTAAEGVS